MYRNFGVKSEFIVCKERKCYCDRESNKIWKSLIIFKIG